MYLNYIAQGFLGSELIFTLKIFIYPWVGLKDR